MMCPGCQGAADKAMAATGSADHDPEACTYVDCTCQHDKGAAPAEGGG